MKFDLLDCGYRLFCIAGGVFRDCFQGIWMLDTQFDMANTVSR